MKFKDNSEFATEEDYDFKALNYTRSWIIAGFIILAVAIALAAASVALPTFVMIAPSVFDASNANVNKARSMGYTQVCFTSDNTCQNRDPSYVDEYSALMTNLRLAELAMHSIAIIIMCICFIAALALIIVWYKKNKDNKCFRNWRLIIGIFLMLAGFCLQSSIIMFHVEQFEDKYGKSSGYPYGFNQWSEKQRTTTSIDYGSGYILLWLATILCFISAWIFLGTYCCWTLDDIDTDDDNPTLPRYSTDSSNMSKRGTQPSVNNQED
ncbi:unnamed protein product [Schistosoma margrebowiei]|uniref:Uncharacterized protein n=2 Tax=Schistosoma margrebowiei TaxID=48269 RepID=A0AA85AKD2_9TREM|nr:unnamed protein product [Schistosoma margrebowiei]